MNYTSTISSPLGQLIIASDGKSITKIDFSDKNIEEKTCPAIEKCKVQLTNYFDGKGQLFNLSLNSQGTPFQQKVWSELQKIPFGETITYQELAERMGDPKLIRAVGTANGKNPIAIIIPCHRVIGAGGKLVGYAGGIWRKRFLLQHELEHNPKKNTLF